VIGDVLARDLRRALGYIHIGLPISGSDTGDYRVRNIIGIDLDRDLLAVGEMLEQGQQHPVRAPRRPGRPRGSGAHGGGDPDPEPRGIRGALYVSCLGRGRHQFGDEGTEVRIVQDALGDVPLVGFFANGEIFANRLYGYTGVLTLFT
jgi:small ligand-binding sensory domain FIST